MAATNNDRNLKRRNHSHNNQEEKEKRFYRIGVHTIKQWADQLGFGEVDDPIAQLLSEDASYRIRQLIQVDQLIYHHSCLPKCLLLVISLHYIGYRYDL